MSLRTSPRRCTPHFLAALLTLAGLAMGVPARAGELAPEPPKTKPKAAAGGEIDLRPKFIVGKVHKFDLDLSDREVPKPLPPGSPKPKAGHDPKPAIFSQKVGISLKVDAVDAEGNATLTLSLESFKMTSDGPAGKVEFDSTKPADAQDPMDTLFRSITTTTMKVAVDRNGEVTSITPDAGSAGGGGAASLITGNITGGDFIKTLVGPIFSPRPGRTSARVGETWTEESQMKASAGDWTLVTTKTLRSHSGGRATIDIKGQVKIEPGSIGGAGANPKSETVQEGQAVWNTELGMVESLNTKMLSEVGLLGGLGDLGKLGDQTGGLGGIDSEAGAQSTPSRHETTIRVNRRR